MGQALYRTYRSKNLSEIVGQEHITQTLSNALKKGLISHAYLFTGPRGVGKTSIARILAHEINNLDYNEKQIHLDIIEIDAASNRRIDEIRDLRDKVHVAPAHAKYKVYIIDEVHMLTREAFNALLKTLEEPPAHAVFILATTEIHKLPETIISRTQRFTFKPVDQAKVIAHLKHIAKEEKIKIDDDALALIAAHGEGSFRDSISLLDQAGNFGTHVTRTDIERTLGIAPTEQITMLVKAITNKDCSKAVTILNNLQEQGSNAAAVAKQLGEQLRGAVLSGAMPKEPTLALLTALLNVPTSANPSVYLEIALLDATLSDAPQAPVAVITPPATPKSGETTQATKAPTAKPVPTKSAKATQSAQIAEAEEESDPVPEQSKTESSTPQVQSESAVETLSVDKASDETPNSDASLDVASWNQVLTSIKQNHNTLYSILRSAEPTFEAGIITLTFAFSFHQRRINEKRNRQIVADTITSVTGEKIIIKCKIGKPKPTSDAPQLPPAELGEQVHTVAATIPEASAESSHEATSDLDYYVKQAEAETNARPLTAINNIFGGAELLES